MSQYPPTGMLFPRGGTVFPPTGMLFPHGGTVFRSPGKVPTDWDTVPAWRDGVPAGLCASSSGSLHNSPAAEAIELAPGSRPRASGAELSGNFAS